MLLCFILNGFGCSQPVKQAAVPVKPSLERIDSAIGLSTAYLVNAVKPNGQFTYRVHPYRIFQQDQAYNILRHAGTMIALAQAHRLQPDEAVGRALLSAGRFMTSTSMAPLPGRSDMLGIWSLPAVNKTGKPPQVKLGGTGLGLAALVRIEKIKPGTTPLADLRRLGRFLLYMQKPNGDFYSKFIPSNGGRYDRWRSLYYPGQAALGLLMLNDLDPGEKWLTAAANALAYLINHRDVTSSDHWLLIAGDKLMSVQHYPESILPRRLLVEHTARVCETIFQEQILYSDHPRRIGGYTLDGRTTPTSTRVEGLGAALRIIGSGDALLTHTVKDSIREAVGFLLRAQIVGGRYAGGIPRGVDRLQGNPAFNRRYREIRIDYVQHALSAMIEFKRFSSTDKQ